MDASEGEIKKTVRMVDSSTALIMGLKSFLDHLLTTITDSTVNGAGTQQMEDKERHPDVIDVLPRKLCNIGDDAERTLPINICILQILLTMSPSTFTTERSFSTLKRIKTYLRSTMGQERLSSLALLYVHSDFDIDTKEVIETFNNARQRTSVVNFSLAYGQTTYERHIHDIHISPD
ncbi:unnamed protein product [Mytilus edulis]|uniref:HAT C-terminal dimerisation domain-containing protein n=1 Tax=Mytilus edulis TaxID=6550 RepID=A0A8S3T5C2_MYTED|nr:unnamed protein product [Mytilus edulis]